MLTLFKSGEISKRLGVSTQTVRRWVQRFPEYFSLTAKADNRYQVFYNPDDVAILLTIHHLSANGHGHDEIEQQLKAGFRYTEQVTAITDAVTISKTLGTDRFMDRVLQAELHQALVERDQALSERTKILETLEKLESKNEAQQEQIAQLMREIAELKYQLGVAAGELNILRRQQDRAS